jgi:membrane-associated protein
VAGVGKMHYSTFLLYNVVGGFIWVTSLTLAGYFFGGLPIIKENFEYAVLGVIFVSLIPVMFEFINHRREARKNKKTETTSYKEIQETFKEEHLND